jgi:hypothetical protein
VVVDKAAQVVVQAAARPAASALLVHLTQAKAIMAAQVVALRHFTDQQVVVEAVLV